MIADTLRSMIDNGVQVSDDEARHAYNLVNEKSTALRRVRGRRVAAKIRRLSADRRLLQKISGAVSRARADQADLCAYEPLVLAAKYTPPDRTSRTTTSATPARGQAS